MFVLNKQTNFQSSESIHLKKYLSKVQLKQTKHNPITVELSSDSSTKRSHSRHPISNEYKLIQSQQNKKAVLSNTDHKSTKAVTDDCPVYYDVYLGKESETG